VQSESAQNAAVAAISRMEEKHWPSVREIYQAGIDTGHATFESSPPVSWAKWLEHHINELSLVALERANVLGWAALSSSSDRCVYAGVAENSVYVAPAAKGRGIGKQLLSALIERSEAKNFWTLQAGIFPENVASLALHKTLGFHPVGTRERLGKMQYGPFAGQWRDVLALERRSTRVGII
jgi:L-amino acid N-acyltransferase YncA